MSKDVKKSKTVENNSTIKNEEPHIPINKEAELKEKYLTKNVSYVLSPLELSFMQSIFGQSMKRNGFRQGKLPAQLIAYYMTQDPKVMQFVTEMHQQQSLEELKKDNKTLYFIKPLNHQYGKNGSLAMTYELYFLEGIEETQAQANESEQNIIESPVVENSVESSEKVESSENTEIKNNKSKKTKNTTNNTI